MKISDALYALRPNAEFVVRGNDYSDIEWHDTSETIPTEAEITTKLNELIAGEPLSLLRQERDRLLGETDWWGVSDRTMTQAETDYRQALRDITDTYSSLDNVVWPTKP